MRGPICQNWGSFPSAQFFCISDIGNSLSDSSQSMKKIRMAEVFRANVIKLLSFDIFLTALQVSQIFLKCQSMDSQLKQTFELDLLQ